MKKITSIQLLGLIFLFSLTVELASMYLTEVSSKSVIRLIFLFALYVLLVKGFSFARYFLGIIYFSSGVLVTFLAINSISNLKILSFYIVTASLSFLSSMFFFRSVFLKKLTTKVKKDRNPQ